MIAIGMKIGNVCVERDNIVLRDAILSSLSTLVCPVATKSVDCTRLLMAGFDYLPGLTVENARMLQIVAGCQYLAQGPSVCWPVCDWIETFVLNNRSCA